MSAPEIDSVWVEDYTYVTGYVRRVKVVGYADDGRAIIENLTDPVGRRSRAKVARFGKKGGYLPEAQ